MIVLCISFPHLFPLPFFVRKLTLQYTQDDEFKGIPAFRYHIAPEEWEPPSENPDNSCYCVHKSRPDRCEFKGMIDVAGCFGGSPFVITLPHFLNVDKDISKQVIGLSPNPEKHTFYLKIKPDIGLPMDAKVRLQFNVRIERMPFLRGFNRVRNTIVPLVWFEDSAELNGFLTGLVKYGLVWTPKTAAIIFYSAAIIGWACFLIGIAFYVVKKVSLAQKNFFKKC